MQLLEEPIHWPIDEAMKRTPIENLCEGAKGFVLRSILARLLVDLTVGAGGAIVGE